MLNIYAAEKRVKEREQRLANEEKAKKAESKSACNLAFLFTLLQKTVPRFAKTTTTEFSSLLKM
jgi:hypothetical protein